MPSRKRRVWWDEGKAAGFLTWAGGFAVSRVACEFCARSNCVNANRDIRLFPRSKKLHAYPPLPLLAADVGCCARKSRPSFHPTGHWGTVRDYTSQCRRTDYVIARQKEGT